MALRTTANGLKQLDYFFNQVEEVAPSNLMVTAVVGNMLDKEEERQLDYFFNQVEEVAPSNLMVTAVVGNMLDKEEERCVQRREGAVYAQKHGFLFLEVSCVTTHGVNDLFEEIIRWLLCSQVGPV
ncbi:GTP-binding protein RHO4 [Ixodes scapularis]